MSEKKYIDVVDNKNIKRDTKNEDDIDIVISNGNENYNNNSKNKVNEKKPLDLR